MKDYLGPGVNISSRSKKDAPTVFFISYRRRRRINVARIRRFRNGVQTLDYKVPEPIFPRFDLGLIGRKPYSSGIQLCNAEERADKVALDQGLISDKTYNARRIQRAIGKK